MEHFSISEFDCKCGCGSNGMQATILSSLDYLRGSMNEPIVITSGFRCPFHNKSVGGSKKSSHITGFAVDIAVPNSSYRKRLLDHIIRMDVFDRIGIGSDFVHVDVDPGKPADVIWTY